MKPYKTLAAVSTATPQTEPILGREDQMIPNNAGGVTFKLDNWNRLDRFLILGTEGGTYYVSEQQHTKQNAANVSALIKEDPERFLKRVIEISLAGRAYRNDAALFCVALALCSEDVKARKLASESISKVARIGTHLFHLAEFVNSLGGWGRLKRKAFARWYRDRPIESLVNQIIKYRQRDGWSHDNVTSLCHPWASYHGARLPDEVFLVMKVLRDGVQPYRELLGQFEGNWAKKLLVFDDIQQEAKLQTEALADSSPEDKLKLGGPSPAALAAINVLELPREALPTEWLRYPETWKTLLPSMGTTALIRNLGNMTRIGVLTDVRQANWIGELITDKEKLQKDRIHPFGVLLAMLVYSRGHGQKGGSSWTPVPQIVDALDTAFYLTFSYVEPTNKVFYLAVDCSGSMRDPIFSGDKDAPHSPVSCCQGAACMAMSIARVEKQYYIRGFSHGEEMVPLGISAKDSLLMASGKAQLRNFGGTDCALPIKNALKEKLFVDCFVVITDNETYFGNDGHPSQWLKKYRKEINQNARMIVVAMTASDNTIADPNDAGMLDCVGFDANSPRIIQEFAAGLL